MAPRNRSRASHASLQATPCSANHAAPRTRIRRVKRNLVLAKKPPRRHVLQTDTPNDTWLRRSLRRLPSSSCADRNPRKMVAMSSCTTWESEHTTRRLPLAEHFNFRCGRMCGWDELGTHHLPLRLRDNPPPPASRGFAGSGRRHGPHRTFVQTLLNGSFVESNAYSSTSSYCTYAYFSYIYILYYFAFFFLL